MNWGSEGREKSSVRGKKLNVLGKEHTEPNTSRQPTYGLHRPDLLKRRPLRSRNELESILIRSYELKRRLGSRLKRQTRHYKQQ